MFYALYYNTDNDDVELYPKLENHSLTEAEIEKYLAELENASLWVIYDHLPNEDDIDSFEELIE